MGRQTKRYSGIGGQAVLEGIMMKNGTRYSVAVRKPDGEIDVEIGEYTGIFGGAKLTKIPFIRGIFAFADSLILGTKCLNHSASFFDEEETKEPEAERITNRALKDRAENILMALTSVIAVVFAVALFMVLPYFITEFLKTFVRNVSLLAIIEGVIRILIFVLYVLLISLMKDIRRVYMYHGAEHKCINCIEHGKELTVKNVMKSSRQHRRCGTSFLLFVMLVSVVLFFFIRVDNMLWKVALRILLIPVIAGIAYEIIRLAGRSDNWLVRMISAPGLWLQGLTTKEPDEDMAQVAIKAVEAVFDWRGYLKENFGYEEDSDVGPLVEEDGEISEPEEPAKADLSARESDGPITGPETIEKEKTIPKSAGAKKQRQKMTEVEPAQDMAEKENRQVSDEDFRIEDEDEPSFIGSDIIE